jgi:hypothetical protein
MLQVILGEEENYPYTQIILIAGLKWNSVLIPKRKNIFFFQNGLLNHTAKLQGNSVEVGSFYTSKITTIKISSFSVSFPYSCVSLRNINTHEFSFILSLIKPRGVLVTDDTF